MAAAGAGAVVVMVALAVGISQATASPACASVIMPATMDLAGAGAPEAAVTGARAGAQTSGEATHYELATWRCRRRSTADRLPAAATSR